MAREMEADNFKDQKDPSIDHSAVYGPGLPHFLQQRQPSLGCADLTVPLDFSFLLPSLPSLFLSFSPSFTTLTFILLRFPSLSNTHIPEDNEE